MGHCKPSQCEACATHLPKVERNWFDPSLKDPKVLAFTLAFFFFCKLGQSSTRTHPAEAKPQRAVSCSCKQPRVWAGISSRELLGAAYRAWTQQELLCCLYLCMCSACGEVLVAYARAKPIPSKCMGLVNRSAIAFPTGIPETVFPPWDVLTRLREVSGCLVL